MANKSSDAQTGRRVGHIREVEPGKWKVQCLRGYDANGKPRYRHATMPGTRQQAEWRLRELEREVGREPGSLPRQISNQTVEQALEAWQQAHATVWTANTRDTQDAQAKRLKPLHYQRVENLTREEIERFRDGLLAQGLSASYVKRIVGSLKTCLGWLVDRDVIVRNPAARVKIPQTKRLMTVPASGDLSKFLAAIQAGHPVEYAGLRLLSVSGARRGEVAALKWIDINGDSIIFRRTIANDLARTVRESLKSADYKVLVFDDYTLEALQKARCDDEWIFGQEDGRPRRPDWFYKRYKRLQEIYDIPLVGRLHDLRHLVATQMLNSNQFSIADVSKRLGHSRISTTLDVYSHVLPGHDEAASEFLAGML